MQPRPLGFRSALKRRDALFAHGKRHDADCLWCVWIGVRSHLCPSSCADHTAVQVPPSRLCGAVEVMSAGPVRSQLPVITQPCKRRRAGCVGSCALGGAGSETQMLANQRAVEGYVHRASPVATACD
eukprot:6169142-Prymnesium_polylepis.1